MIYQISEKPHTELEAVYEKSMQELSGFFETDWNRNRPQLILIPDRKTINSIQWEETEDWLVGWVHRWKDVYVLCPENFEKESDHIYSDTEYFALIKHELAHCFTNIVAASTSIPIWLNEGISIFLSWQIKTKARPEKLMNFLEFYNDWGSEVYKESGFAVELLVKTHGKEKLLELVRNTRNTKTREEFSELFKSIYGFELSYDNFIFS